jgi:hypothetical protein
MRALLAAVVLGMLTGSSEHGKPVTELRLPYSRLILGTWVTQDRSVEMEFHRGRRVCWPTRLPGLPLVEGRYAIRGEILVYSDGSVKERLRIVRLDGRSLVLENEVGSRVSYQRQ